MILEQWAVSSGEEAGGGGSVFREPASSPPHFHEGGLGPDLPLLTGSVAACPGEHVGPGATQPPRELIRGFVPSGALVSDRWDAKVPSLHHLRLERINYLHKILRTP